jgi:transposase
MFQEREEYTAGASFSNMAEVAQRPAGEQIVMVLDGAGWHRAGDLQVPPNVQLLPLPPNSPQLNPMEHIWDEIREKWFPNLVFNSLKLSNIVWWYRFWLWEIMLFLFVQLQDLTGL